MTINGKIRQSASLPLTYWPLTFQLHPCLLNGRSLIGAQFADVLVQSAFLLLFWGLPKGDKHAFLGVATLYVAGRLLVDDQVVVLDFAQGDVVFDPGQVVDPPLVRGDIAVKRDGLTTCCRDIGAHRQACRSWGTKGVKPALCHCPTELLTPFESIGSNPLPPTTTTLGTSPTTTDGQCYQLLSI